MPTNKSIFTQYIADTLEREPKITPPAELKMLPAGKLLNWLLHCWGRDTISMREICWRGPNGMRDRKNVMDMTETLTQRGWLLPLPTQQINRKEWKIIREIE
jgi:hypothetical protein